MRIGFFYFIKNYDLDLAHREMTENSHDGIGVGSSRSSVSMVFANCRDRISRHQLYTIKQRKMGGPGKEVVVDYMKLSLRCPKENKNIEWLIFGFMEREHQVNISGRCRAYVVPNLKI